MTSYDQIVSAVNQTNMRQVLTTLTEIAHHKAIGYGKANNDYMARCYMDMRNELYRTLNSCPRV